MVIVDARVGLDLFLAAGLELHAEPGGGAGRHRDRAQGSVGLEGPKGSPRGRYRAARRRLGDVGDLARERRGAPGLAADHGAQLKLPGRMIGRGDEHAQTIGGRVVGADDRATYLEADARHLARVEGLHREEERPGGERVGSWAVDQRLWSRTCGRLIAAVGAGSGG